MFLSRQIILRKLFSGEHLQSVLDRIFLCYAYLEISPHIFFGICKLFLRRVFSFLFCPFENTHDFETRNDDNQIFISAIFKNRVQKGES